MMSMIWAVRIVSPKLTSLAVSWDSEITTITLRWVLGLFESMRMPSYTASLNRTASLPSVMSLSAFSISLSSLVKSCMRRTRWSKAINAA